MLDPNQSVADLVLEHSECASILQRHRIDFCCHGSQSIQAACDKAGLDVDRVVAELLHAIESRQVSGEDPRDLSTKDLITHIVSRHHDYLRQTMSIVVQLATKVARVHGGRNPNLPELRALVDELSGSIMPHLDFEESVLFPAVRAEPIDREVVGQELASMMNEHLLVGELLGRIRTATEEFRTPDWACTSYRTLFSELEQLEADVLKHVHLENHVLMPRFAQDKAN